MSTIPIDDKLMIGPDRANIDGRYKASNNRPYTSVAAAEVAINLVIGNVGLTVLVADENDPDYPKAKEYWVQPKGTTPETYGLEPKPGGTTDYADLDNKPTISDGGQGSTQIPLSGNVKVTATAAASGQTTGVAVTAENGGITMAFTLEKGADGVTPTIDPTTRHWMIGGVDTGILAQGADGQDGATPTINQTTKHWEIGGSDTGVSAEGHNPNRGTYNVGDTLPSDGVAGDYIVVVDTTQSTPTAEIHKWDATLNNNAGGWAATGVAPSDAEFEDGELVVNTKIDDTHLANPAPNALAKAEDVMTVKDDLKSLDVQINGGVDIKNTVNAKEMATAIRGRFGQSSDSWLDNSSQHSFKVDLETLKSQGYNKLIITANGEDNAWYSLLKDTFPITESNYQNIASSAYMSMVSSVMDGVGADTISANESKTIDITGSDIKYLVYAGEIVISSVNYDKTPSVVSVVKEVVETALVYDGLDSESPNKALSAKQGKVLKDKIGELKEDVEGIDDTEILADGTNIWQTVIGRGFNTPAPYWDISSSKTSKYIDLSTYKENGCNKVVVKGNSTKKGGYTLFNSSFNPSEITENIEGSTYLNMLSTSMEGAGFISIEINEDVVIDVTNNDIKYITFVDYDSRLPQSVKLIKRTVSTGLITRVEALEESIGNVPQLVIDTGRIISSLAENKRSDVRDKVRPLKILFIGNSFTWGTATDSFRNFTRLFTALGYEVVVGVSYQPSATVQYYDSIKDASTKVQYVKIKNTSSIISYDSNYKNTTIEKVVDENWDVVFFIQGSASAGWYASYEPYFTNLVNWLQSKVLSLGCKVGWFMPWAWTTNRIQNVPSGGDTYKGNDGQPTTNIDNATMFQQICTATQSNIQAHPEIALFAPCGTAVENQYTNHPNSDVYANDGQHLTNSPYSTTNDCTNAGKFAAQLALFGVLAKYFYNIELSDIVYNTDFRVVEEVFNQAKTSALNAISTPYEVTVIS